jgi:hypothetical protein
MNGREMKKRMDTAPIKYAAFRSQFALANKYRLAFEPEGFIGAMRKKQT